MGGYNEKSELFKAVYAENKNRRTAHGSFGAGIGDAKPPPERGLRGNVLFPGDAVLGNGPFDVIHLGVVRTDEQGCVAGHEKTAGGRKLGDKIPFLGKDGGDLGRIVVVHNRKNSFIS